MGGAEALWLNCYVAAVLLAIWVNDCEAWLCAFLPVYNIAAQFDGLLEGGLFAFALCVSMVAIADFNHGGVHFVSPK